MRTNLRFIARAIDWPSEVLPTPGGPTKQRIGPLICNRSRFVGLQLPHRQILDDPFFDLVEIVVVFVEHLARFDGIEAILGRAVQGTSSIQSKYVRII